MALNTVCPASKVHAWAAGWGYETAMNSAGVRGHTTFEHNVRTPEPVAGDVGVSSARLVGGWVGCGEEASGVLAPHSTRSAGAQRTPAYIILYRRQNAACGPPVWD